MIGEYHQKAKSEYICNDNIIQLFETKFYMQVNFFLQMSYFNCYEMWLKGPNHRDLGNPGKTNHRGNLCEDSM